MKIEIGGIYQIKDIEGYYAGLNGSICVVEDIKDTDVKIMICNDPNTYWVDKMYLKKYSLHKYNIENDNMDNLSNSLDFDDDAIWDYLVSYFWSEEEMDHTVAERASNDNMLRQNCSSQN